LDRLEKYSIFSRLFFIIISFWRIQFHMSYQRLPECQIWYITVVGWVDGHFSDVDNAVVLYVDPWPCPKWECKYHWQNKKLCETHPMFIEDIKNPMKKRNFYRYLFQMPHITCTICAQKPIILAFIWRHST
jgi:hypothetical protein